MKIPAGIASVVWIVTATAAITYGWGQAPSPSLVYDTHEITPLTTPSDYYQKAEAETPPDVLASLHPITYYDPDAARGDVAELCDGLGHCWRWGAWRNPDDTAWEAPLPQYSTGISEAASTSAPSTGSTTYSGSYSDAYAACLVHPDRYNWRAYAAAYDWPLDELATVIWHESKDDLCAVNPYSGAICWIQQISGEAIYFDPATCMSIGYSKWVSGGRSFYQHWYQWWG